MIDVNLYGDDTTLGVELCGHAGYNPGNDIVCSAASVLMYSLANYCFDYCADRCCVEDTDESFIIEIEDPEEVDVGAYMLMREGMETLRDNYPDNVNIERVEMP